MKSFKKKSAIKTQTVTKWVIIKKDIDGIPYTTVDLGNSQEEVMQREGRHANFLATIPFTFEL